MFLKKKKEDKFIPSENILQDLADLGLPYQPNGKPDIIYDNVNKDEIDIVISSKGGFNFKNFIFEISLLIFCSFFVIGFIIVLQNNFIKEDIVDSRLEIVGVSIVDKDYKIEYKDIKQGKNIIYSTVDTSKLGPFIIKYKKGVVIKSVNTWETIILNEKGEEEIIKSSDILFFANEN